MSLSSALSNSASGLNAASRGMNAVSDNVANALTPGYVRRTPDVSSRLDGGVAVGPDIRSTAHQLTGERRIADASIGSAQSRSTALTRVANAFGTPGSDQTLSASLAKLEGALGAAALSPENTQTLVQVTEAASGIVDKITNIAQVIQAERQAADDRIGAGVQKLNQGIEMVDTLNRAIVIGNAQGQPVAALQDQRAGVLDQIADLVPLKTVERATGEVAVFTARGATLLDGSPSTVSFDQTNGVPLDDVLATEIMINGQPDTSNLLFGGSLGASIDLRDTALLQAATTLATFSALLVSRFETADPERGANAGLFGIGGGPLPDPAPDDLPLHITLGAQFDSAQGGTAENLRSNVDPSTDGARLLSIADAFKAGDQSIETLAIDVSVGALSIAARSEQDLVSQQAIGQSARAAEQNVTAVDTDFELQNLLKYETAFAANARVMTAVDQMLRQLMEI